MSLALSMVLQFISRIAICQQLGPSAWTKAGATAASSVLTSGPNRYLHRFAAPEWGGCLVGVGGRLGAIAGGDGMLGTLRLVLALCVVFAHIGALPAHFHTGIYAVFGFYVLSGFLVTGILNGTYRDRPFEFALNRALKIFPAYYVVALATIPTILFLPSGSYHFAWAASVSTKNVIANLFLFPLAWAEISDFRVVPPAWSVGVELIGYAIIFAVIGRRWWLAALSFMFSATYHAHALMVSETWATRYFPVWAAVLPFSTGALIFFLRPSIGNSVSRWLIGIGGAAWIINLVLMTTENAAALTLTFGAGFYINLIALAMFIAGLSALPRNSVDDYLGDLSYPIFLVHWQVDFLMVIVFGIAPHGLAAFGWCLLPITLVAALIKMLLQATVDPLRSAIRERGPQNRQRLQLAE